MREVAAPASPPPNAAYDGALSQRAYLGSKSSVTVAGGELQDRFETRASSFYRVCTLSELPRKKYAIRRVRNMQRMQPSAVHHAKGICDLPSNVGG